MTPGERAKKFLRIGALQRGIVIRSVICLIIGISVLFIDETDSFDVRFQMRGTQTPTSDIVVLELSRADLLSLLQNPMRKVFSFHQANFSEDEFLANPSVWAMVLQQILDMGPKKIGVSLTADKDLGVFSNSSEDQSVFRHAKVIWDTQVDSEGRVKDPLLVQPARSNIGASHLLPDPDLVFRRFQPVPPGIPDFIEKLSGKRIRTSRIINFHGPQGTFTHLTLNTLLSSRNARKMIENKIVLVGRAPDPNHLIKTPVGFLSRPEFFANVLEDTLHEKWIIKVNMLWYQLSLLVLLGFSVWIIFRYPQTATVIYFVLLSTTFTAISIWIFDSYYMWFPILSPLLQLFSTFVIFISFQLAIQEKTHWRLTQEARAHHEIEQLKNNFVSLFSHDLKTPIAKIQAIVDRRLAQNPNDDMANDLRSLRRSSEELYRYIQKILHISRIESQKIKLNKESADINEIVSAAVARLSPLAKEKNITIATDRPPLFSVEIDITLIEEVILNLIDNAIKYSRPGTEIKIATSEEDNCVVVSVTDQGTGISKETQSNVWSKFTRGSEIKESIDGFGLGLYLSKYFIELHEGEISLDSTLGKGTTVRFSLPFEIYKPNDLPQEIST